MRQRVPSSTYRVQVTPDLDLCEVARLLPYLHDLGVDWVYLSPLLTAETASDHGYDVVAHDRVDPARGGTPGLAALAAEARRLGMGLLVDIVPNHVGVETPAANSWWWDVLRHGRDSLHATAFDVDWAAGGGRIRVPLVGDDDLRPDGTIANLEVVDGELRYHDHRFPLAPGTAPAPGEGADPQAIHARQHYELVSWRAADDSLNYRRFFAVNTLAGLRVEDRDVLERSHVEIRRWFDEGLVDGLRVDHPDGLRHPDAYLHDLAEITGGAYVVVEKILEHGETLPARWPTAGTTGYDALALLDRVLTDPRGETPLGDLDDALRGWALDWPALVHDSKRAVADGILRSEVRRIGREIQDGRRRRGWPSVAPEEVEDAVAELLACFPVYRSYLPEGRAYLDLALARARARRPDLAAALEDLAPLLADPVEPAALRFQQTSGMVMAKGVEDSAFYRWGRLTSLNEVGADPALFAVSPSDFHAAMAARQSTQPHALTALSTHDTKRAEDVRARIAVLAEMPGRWASVVRRLLELAPLPDQGFGNLLWQAVVGAWPASRERLHAYAEKAMREAGDRTSWTEPDAGYEAAVHRAVDAAFDDPEVRALVEELVADLALPGWSNGLAAKLVALTMPGVPDVYQGSELWEQSLVDPDNRRPVDFAMRARLLDEVAGGPPAPLRATPDDPGLAKLQLTRAALRLRRERPELFGTYVGLTAIGTAPGHLLAFDRGGALTMATRLPVGLAAAGGWGETTLDLPAGRWRDAVAGTEWSGRVPVGEVLATHPAVLLVKESE